MTEWHCQLCESGAHGTAVKRSKVDLSICSWCESELARTGRLRCRRCNVVKPRSDFKVHNARYCRGCRADAAVPYRAANRARVRARRAADPDLRERDRLRTQAWRDAHPTESRAQARARYRQNRAARLAWQYAYYWRHRDRILTAQRRVGPVRGRAYRIRRKLRILHSWSAKRGET